MSKGMFDRLFKFMVKKCNETLDTQQKRQHFIGVLDIAGFEIFDVSIPSNTCMMFEPYYKLQRHNSVLLDNCDTFKLYTLIGTIIYTYYL